MGLNTTKAPEEGSGIVREALGKLISHAPTTAGMLAESAPGQLSIAAPHAVYFVGLTDVAEGNLLSAATLTGWRYIVLAGEEAIGAANLRIREDDPTLQFSHISHGPFVQNTVEGIRLAESLPAVAINDYELRLLDIPSLYVVCLWLHGNEDQLIPLPPSSHGLAPYKSYSDGEIAAALKGPATERLQAEPIQAQ